MAVNPKKNLVSVWHTSDTIFQRHVTELRALEQPIPYRHPYLFYLGHLPAFAWRQIRYIRPDLPHVNAEYEVMFERGIDPIVGADNVGNIDNSHACVVWPAWDRVLEFRDTVRVRILHLLGKVPNRTLSIIIEHDAMHNETLAYMLAQSMRDVPAPINEGVPVSFVNPSAANIDIDIAFRGEWCYIPGDTVSLGIERDENIFVWDNEVGNESHAVKSFHVRKYPVTNAEFAAFIRANGYNEQKYWDETDWMWVAKNGIQEPASFRKASPSTTTTTSFWDVLTPNGFANMRAAANWPAFVSFAEAKAYTKWTGESTRLPTEPEWNLYSRRSSTHKLTASASSYNHNYNHNHNYRYPHDVRKGAKSDFGVVDCVGNGWEWTASVFEPFQGFEVMPEYREYSTDFFDSNHYVLKGASYATWDGMVRKSFRNFFQGKYPYMFAQFRLVKSTDLKSK